MQVKTVDGNVVQISPVEIQRIHKSLPMSHKTADMMAETDFDPQQAYQATVKYKDKAAHNLKRIAECQNMPESQQQAKDLLLEILMHGSSQQFADAIGQLAQYQAARVVLHALEHCVDEVKQ